MRAKASALSSIAFENRAPTDFLETLRVNSSVPSSSFRVEASAAMVDAEGNEVGTVELTVALHYVFNTPKDQLVWDVGHQAYGHKILTVLL